ncbi:MAG: AAA domain-containing protein [Legionella sp.]|nr:AAA domain-containing protein [Legionella sp.]
MDISESIDNLGGQEACLKVLRYWHRLEFFVPFDLDNALSGGAHSFDIALDSLVEEKTNRILPWLRSNQGDFYYVVYLLPFDKNELTKLSTRFFPLEYQDQNSTDLEEKLDDEGLTCFARITVDKYGSPLWSGLSVSTMPWAMGMMQSGEFEQLTEDLYQRDMTLLKSAINVLENEFEKTRLGASTKGLFDVHLLHNLLNVLIKWAQFTPKYPLGIKIKAYPVKEIKTPAESLKVLTQNLPVLENEMADDNESLVEEQLSNNEPLEILNSFYISDLEKSIRFLKNKDHEIIKSYINGSLNRTDVLSVENQISLINQLYPMNTPLGRWPSDSKNMMSMMQQYFINQCFNPSLLQPIMATNGPPGTGKTTLLKDIISENIVKRARALSTFDSVQDCFIEKRKIVISDKVVTISILREELTGFELLVASSNNTAVENISKELPLKNNLGPEYRETCQYLRPVAAKLRANHYNNRVLPISQSSQPWGLISVALGKSANRNEFINRFFFSPDSDNNLKDRLNLGEYLSIWEWRDQYRGPGFNDAKKVFKATYDAVVLLQNQLQQFAELGQIVLEDPWVTKIKKIENQQRNLEEECKKINEEKIQQEQSLVLLAHHKKLVYQEIEQTLCFKPSLLKRIFNTTEARSFKVVVQQLQDRRFKLTQELLELQEKIECLSKQLLENQTALAKGEALINKYQIKNQEMLEQFKYFKTLFPKVNLPSHIISNEDQIRSYWQCEHYNKLRSDLFIHGLQLHEAWLAESLQQKCFGGNLFALNSLLSGKKPISFQDELVIWQSLFMVIPVVSSTFASIGRQFKNLEAQSLGLLLIDEAGQAIPQAAIGALLRCKKVIVVGDPRQIEPVMTLPPHLIEGVAKHHFNSNFNPYWLPHITSIQRLADLASPIGTLVNLNNQPEWIGVPLLVHRRCLEPMFSIANEIAYDNKMINARGVEQFNYTNGHISVWFDVPGIATEKQYVPEQGKWVLNLFIALFNEEKKLPDLFIITPFRIVKNQISNLFQNQDRWKHRIDPQLTINPIEFRAWVSKHIGTVHTFQGKEAHKVILVLGTDKNQLGAINWACSKPNLLNVALTRATERIYLVGDWDLWANKRYFSNASAQLDRIKINKREEVVL